MEDIYQKHLMWISEIKEASYRVLEIWEHELRQQLTANPEMTHFFEQVDIQEPIEFKGIWNAFTVGFPGMEVISNSISVIT